MFYLFLPEVHDTAGPVKRGLMVYGYEDGLHIEDVKLQKKKNHHNKSVLRFVLNHQWEVTHICVPWSNAVISIAREFREKESTICVKAFSFVDQLHVLINDLYK
jgi:hypothetical protein